MLPTRPKFAPQLGLRLSIKPACGRAPQALALERLKCLGLGERMVSDTNDVDPSKTFFQPALTTIIRCVLLSQATAPTTAAGGLPNGGGPRTYEKAVRKHAPLNCATLDRLR